MIHTVKNFSNNAFVSCLLFALLSKASAQVSNTSSDVNFKTITNKTGPTLGVAKTSAVKILTVNGLHFKDLNKNGTLDKYEDWRLTVDDRAKDLASKMTVEQIAGLMLYSAHQ